MDVDTIPDELLPVALTQPHDNYTILKLLRREINYIMKHGIQLSDGWYEERSNYIYSYMEIGWADISLRFKEKDGHLYICAANIVELLYTLTEQLSTSVRFDLMQYYKLIEEIHHIWHYYRNTYVGNETDADMVSMIESMTFLMK